MASSNDKNKKVLVAMSGGVDSSVAAALLVKQGYLVTGGFMKNFSRESWEGVMDNDCPWEQDFADVRAVCEKLGIECRSFNFEKEYRDKVIEYFFREYASGRTPNPDVMCNKEIKFGIFLEKALELGFDFVATGHYARLRREFPISNFQFPDKIETPNYQLLKGLDSKKDQSYFLYSLNQKQLAKTLFPVGEYTKPEIRKMARRFGLPNADKKDSQGVCFVGHIKLYDFLKQRIPEKAGEIVDISGSVVGKHRGAWYYTIGQRKGIGVGGGVPYYVAQKDVLKNKLVVSPLKIRGDEGGLYSSEAIIENLHWIGSAPEMPLKCKAKIRYQQKDSPVKIFFLENFDGQGPAVKVVFDQPQFAIAPGQSIVFYTGDHVLGGGVIA